MNLANRTENAARTDELIDLIDRWPNCDQERAIELQIAFDKFSAAGSRMDPLPSGQKEHFCSLMYEIKRGDAQRQIHFHNAHEEVMEEARRQA
jgi:hypothetical protein